jgi:hypothetical protein
MREGIFTRTDTAMRAPLTPEQEQQAQILAERLRTHSTDAFLEMARRLVQTSDATLFGDTEFALRATALGFVAEAYAEHLEKKVATTAVPSTVLSAEPTPRSTTTGPKPS